MDASTPQAEKKLAAVGQLLYGTQHRTGDQELLLDLVAGRFDPAQSASSIERIHWQGIYETRKNSVRKVIVPESWLSAEEVAEHLGVIKDTVYSWIATKGMPAHKVGRLWKFQISEVDEWVRSGGAAEE
jgi:excisionase family DNA binding protein